MFRLPLVIISRRAKMSVNPFWLTRTRALSPRVCHHDCWHHHPENERCISTHIVTKQKFANIQLRVCLTPWANGIIWWWMSTSAHRYIFTTFLHANIYLWRDKNTVCFTNCQHCAVKVLWVQRYYAMAYRWVIAKRMISPGQVYIDHHCSQFIKGPQIFELGTK